MTAKRAPSADEQPFDAAVVERRLVSVEAREAVAVRARLHPARWVLFTDLCFGLIAYALALTVRGGVVAGEEVTVFDGSWSMLVPLAFTFVVFYAMGLYERELLSLRALQLLTLA